MMGVCPQGCWTCLEGVKLPGSQAMVAVPVGTYLVFVKTENNYGITFFR